MPFLNKNRLHVYPLLVLIALWFVTLFNLIFPNGWYGRLGGFIGYDFLSFYSGGKLYWTDTVNLYNQDTLANLQNQLVGIPQSGMNYFPYPPYIAMVYGLFSFIPYTAALIIWTMLSLACLILSAYLIHHYLIPKGLKEKGFTLPYLLVIVFSFYPTIFGLQDGQNHTFSLLLITLIIIFTVRRNRVLAGICGGILLFDPQIVLGWLILWLLWKNYKALLAFMLTGAGWVGLTLIHKGGGPFLEYLRYIPTTAWIYQFGHPLEVTPIAMINRMIIFLFGTTNLTVISLLAFIGFIIGIVFVVRRYEFQQHQLPMMLAILFPLLNFHALYYDLVLLIPFFALWSQISQSKIILLTTIGIYFSALILLPISLMVNFPFMGILPLLIILAVALDLKANSSLNKYTRMESG